MVWFSGIRPELLAWLDRKRAELTPEASRPEMIRRLIEAIKTSS